MKKRTVWVAALMSLSVTGMAQQVLPKDAAGDKEYARVCKEYELKSENSIELLEAYLKQYPDSRHANRIESMIASVYFNEGKYAEAARKQIGLISLIDALFSDVNPIPVKAAMAKMGFCKDYLRLPLTPMEDEHKAVLYNIMDSLGL